MRRRLYFDYSPTENQYIIQEENSNIFNISGDTLKFVSLDFYKGVYAGKKSTAIDFENKIADDPLKKGRYIFDWIKDILNAVEEELPESEEADKESIERGIVEIQAVGEIRSASKTKKVIPLFDWPACAGDGLYFDQANVPFNNIEADNPSADYAVKISGESMEPTIANEAIVLVRKVNELSNGDVGIFSVDGEIMCKRYCVNGADIILRPDNQSGGFSDIDVSGAECLIQGKVILE